MKTRIVFLGFLALAALALHIPARADSTSVVPPPGQPYLVISNSPSAVFLTAYNTVPNVAYLIQTNTDVTNPNTWAAWVTVTASSTVTPLSSLGLEFKEIFFRAIVLSSNAPGFSSNPQQSLYLGKLDLNTATNRNSAQLTAGKSQSDQSLPKWGRIINPDADCNFYHGKEGVTISVPGTPHDLAAEIDRTNAPRVLQDVEGDFSIQVRTDGHFVPGEISTQSRRKSYNGAAIIVTSDPDNVVTLARAVFQAPGYQPAYYANFEIRSGGKLHRIGRTGDCRLPADGPVFLRLERRGSEITGAISLNGTDWQPLGKKDIPSDWPAKLSTGIAAISTSESEFAPRFSDLQISK